MHGAPPRLIEKIVWLLIPPAAREEVLGDLCERCTSPGKYVQDALLVVPFVIFSRIRRTADSQVVVMEAAALYLSFLVVAWCYQEPAVLENSGLLKLAIPVVMILLGIVLEDAYSVHGKRSVWKSMRGPVLGVILAYLSELVLWGHNHAFALPSWITTYGSAISLMFSISAKLLFPAELDRQAGIGAPAYWHKRSVERSQIQTDAMSIVKILALVLTVAFVAAQLGGSLATVTVVVISIVLLVLREMKRYL